MTYIMGVDLASGIDYQAVYPPTEPPAGETLTSVGDCLVKFLAQEVAGESVEDMVGARLPSSRLKGFIPGI